MIIQLDSKTAVNTDYIKYIWWNNDSSTTMIWIESINKYNDDESIEINSPFKEVMKKIKLARC